MTAFPVVIHHNPDCGTSRNVLRIIEAAGYQPTIIPYLETGWTRAQLLALFAAANVTPRQALREKKSPAAELGLLAEGVGDEKILAAMLLHPILVERPFVATPLGVRLCRPSEAVLNLLERLPPGPFSKDDGELVVDAQGRPATAILAQGAFAVRAATPDDADALAAIYNQGIADRIATFETDPRTADTVKAWFDGKHPVMAALTPSGEIAACAASFAYADRCVYSGVAEFSVYTRRDQRGRGAGRAALAALIAAAPQAGLWKLVSRVFTENAASRALLKSVGFSEIGIHRAHGKLDGVWRDVIVVERLV